MRRMENEHGCTLSRSEDMSTRGRSHAPPWLTAQMSVEVAGLNCRTSIPRMNTAAAPPMIRVCFISRCYERFYFKLKRAADGIGEGYEPVYAPDAGRTVCIRVVDNADGTTFARRNGLIRRRDG